MNPLNECSNEEAPPPLHNAFSQKGQLPTHSQVDESTSAETSRCYKYLFNDPGFSSSGAILRQLVVPIEAFLNLTYQV